MKDGMGLCMLSKSVVREKDGRVSAVCLGYNPTAMEHRKGIDRMARMLQLTKGRTTVVPGRVATGTLEGFSYIAVMDKPFFDEALADLRALALRSLMIYEQNKTYEQFFSAWDESGFFIAGPFEEVETVRLWVEATGMRVTATKRGLVLAEPSPDPQIEIPFQKEYWIGTRKEDEHKKPDMDQLEKDPRSLGDRMKWLEGAGSMKLEPGLPAVVRIDGRAFHTYTRGFDKPFDDKISGAMNAAMLAACQRVQGAVLGYTQSDEITILLAPSSEKSGPWFDGRVDKIVSVVASMVAGHFNSFMDASHWLPLLMKGEISFEQRRMAEFDARAWTVPVHEVCNTLIWRQQDAERNSVSALAQSLFSHKELQNKNVDTMRQMCSDAGNSWEALSTSKKLGTCAVKVYYEKDGAERSKWVLDRDIPRFVSSRDYVDGRLPEWLRLPQSV